MKKCALYTRVSTAMQEEVGVEPKMVAGGRFERPTFGL